MHWTYWLTYFIYVLVGLWVLATAVAFAKDHNDRRTRRLIEQEESNDPSTIDRIIHGNDS